MPAQNLERAAKLEAEGDVHLTLHVWRQHSKARFTACIRVALPQACSLVQPVTKHESAMSIGISYKEALLLADTSAILRLQHSASTMARCILSYNHYLSCSV